MESLLPKFEEYREKASKMNAQHQEFSQKLNSALKEDFNDILDNRCMTCPLELETAFHDGFRLGARIILETYDDIDGRNK